MPTLSFQPLLCMTLCGLWLQWSRGLGALRAAGPSWLTALRPQHPPPCRRPAAEGWARVSRLENMDQQTLSEAALGQACSLRDSFLLEEPPGLSCPGCRPSASWAEIQAHGEDGLRHTSPSSSQLGPSGRHPCWPLGCSRAPPPLPSSLSQGLYSPPADQTCPRGAGHIHHLNRPWRQEGSEAQIRHF